MTSKQINILLADDDHADCLLFKEALEELPIATTLSMVHDGEQLLEALNKERNSLPDVLFLDLNMPRKNGFAALGTIKNDNNLDSLPIIIFSTTSEPEAKRKTFRNAAHYYICKPNDFEHLKKVIYEALLLITDKSLSMPGHNKFMITGESTIIPEKQSH